MKVILTIGQVDIEIIECSKITNKQILQIYNINHNTTKPW